MPNWITSESPSIRPNLAAALTDEQLNEDDRGPQAVFDDREHQSFAEVSRQSSPFK